MKNVFLLGVLCGMLALCCGNLAAQSSSFTYQGLLKINNNPAKEPVDLRFELYNAAAEGVQIGSVNYIDDLNIVNGVFTANLDFGADAFDGSERWVEIAARPGSADNSDRNGYETLAPRQKITPTPYAIQSGNAALLSGRAISYFAKSEHTHTAKEIVEGAFGDDQVSDNISISSYGRVDGAAINKGVVSANYIDPAIARDSELPYEAVVAPSGGNYTTIQAALAANAKTIFVRNGTYILASDIEIAKSGTVIVGESRDGVILDCNHAYGIMANSAGSRFSQGTISITSGGTAVTGNGTAWIDNGVAAGQYIYLGSDWHKIASVVNNTTLLLEEIYWGKTLSNSSCEIAKMITSVRLENLTLTNFNNSTRGAIYWKCVLNSEIRNCAVINSYEYGIHFNYADNCRILNCHLVTNHLAGIYLYSSRNNHLSGNYCCNNIMDGIQIYFSNNATLNGNHCLSNGSNGINVVTSSYNNVMNNESLNNRKGLSISYSHFNAINANHFKGNAEGGIVIVTESDMNNIVGNSSISNDGYGVNIQSSSCNFNIVGMNSLSGNTAGAGSDSGSDTQQKSTNYPTF